MKDNNKQEFQYLSQERIQEVHKIFETFQKADWVYPAYKEYLSQNQRDFNYIKNKPFKKFSILKKVPLKVISIS